MYADAGVQTEFSLPHEEDAGDYVVEDGAWLDGDGGNLLVDACTQTEGEE